MSAHWMIDMLVGDPLAGSAEPMVAAIEGFRWALLFTAFGLGARHGVDWDHIAAITDLASGSRGRRRSLRLASLYALGHAAVVIVVGSLAVIAGDYLPDTIDDVMGRVVGVTLVLLGGWVFYALSRDRRRFRMRSRWSLLAAVVRRRRAPVVGVIVIDHDHAHAHHHGAAGGHGHTHPRIAPVEPKERHAAVATTTHHGHRHVHVGSLPDEPRDAGGRAAFGVGVLHGIGAETPTQVVLFAAAAGAAGALTGELLLVAFTLGLLAANTVVAVAVTTGFLQAERHFGVYAAIAVVSAAFSIVLGLSYLLGLDVLPSLLTG